MSISVNNLSKNYGNQKAVNNISFDIKKGEIVGFLGPNGAGKSTTMKIITGYIESDSGEVKVCNEKVSSDSLLTKRKIGYLPEANPLYFEMYVREYLEFVASVHLLKEPAEKIESIIKTVGLSAEANKKTGQLSKGYKQRVGLAAALIHDPEVLILDEPTSGLDPNQIIEIREVIKTLGRNKTVLFSSHILQEVEAICDRVIIINKGNIVADDTLLNLQANKQHEHIVLITFKEKVDVAMLRSIKNIHSIDNEDGYKFKIQTDNPESIRRQLIEMSLKNNLNIVSLQSEGNSLESIFKSLTSLNN